MRLQILSDLHTELNSYNPVQTDADIVVLAGDIGHAVDALEWSRMSFPDKPIIYVPGNHELYDVDFQSTLSAMRSRARELDIEYLDNDSIIIGGIRFVGSTLWADFKLFGAGHIYEEAFLKATELIKASNARKLKSIGWMLPEHTISMHKTAVQFLKEQLETTYHGPTVVVTHHAPSIQSIMPNYREVLATASLASNLDELIPLTNLWVHGHIHDYSDYTIGSSPGRGRVICNPRGYGLPREGKTGWNPGLVIEV